MTGNGQSNHGLDSDKTLRILAVGFLPPPLGGVSVSFKTFCELLSGSDDVQLSIINLAGRRRRGRLLRDSFSLLAELSAAVKACDLVSLYCATPQVPTLGLAVLFLSRWHGKRMILRKAAGLDYRLLGPVAGRLAEFVVRHVDLFLAQTRELVERCRRRGIAHVAWYPTSRPLARPRQPRPCCERFLYVGHVRQSKGIDELIEAAAGLPANASIDVFGPFFDHFNEPFFANRPQIRYRGILDPDQVQVIMRGYDALVLPSKATTEGYPGAILEALSVGLPVITTPMGGIPEIVDERFSMLVPPGDASALREAMQRLIFDLPFYQGLCRGALEARERFSTQYWVDWFVTRCQALCQQLDHRGKIAETHTEARNGKESVDSWSN